MPHSQLASVSRASRTLLDATVVALLAFESPAQVPSGSWTPVYDWGCQFPCTTTTIPSEMPVEFSHAALIPTGVHRGSVLLWRLDCNNTVTTTTDTWIFDPGAPQSLAKVTQVLESEIFCSGLSWDPEGNLIVAGGVGSPFPKQTYRFRPGVLTTTATSSNPCTQPPTIGYTRKPWETQGQMAVRRYYPTLITLLRRSIMNASTPSIVAGGATLVLGGPWLRPPLPAPGGVVTNYGNQWWETLAKGSPAWALPLYPTASVPTLPPNAPAAPTPGNFEPYVPNQGAFAPTAPQVLLDSYPRAFQLADIGNGPSQTKENILVTSDTETAAFSVPTNPGSAWVMRTPLSAGAAQVNWELFSLVQAGTTTGATTQERFYGTAVLMHRLDGNGGLNRVLVFGGSQDPNFQFASPGVPAPTTTMAWTVNTSVQEVLLSTDPTNQLNLWTAKAPTAQPRVYLNGVVLPIGQVFLVGGASSYNHPGVSVGTPVATSPVNSPELYDPGQFPTSPGSTQPLPASSVPAGFSVPTPRLYHSLATLLPDGRVFVAGGHDLDTAGTPASKYTGEIYEPYYVGTPANRPAILSGPMESSFLPATIDLDFELPPGFSMERVVLLRPAAVTHHFDSDQRYIELAFTPPTPGIDAQLVVTCPREDLGPPGWYMLFLVAKDPATNLLWPSIAHWIRFQ